jgi:hypothetical protein
LTAPTKVKRKSLIDFGELWQHPPGPPSQHPKKLRQMITVGRHRTTRLTGACQQARYGLLVVVTVLVSLVSGYECDAGKTNVSSRTRCPKWLSGEHNETHCSIDLGCCFAPTSTQRGVNCYSPVDSAGTTNLKLPVITNPNLQWLGFFGQPTPNESGYEPDAQRGIATFGCDENLTTLVRVPLFHCSCCRLKVDFHSLYRWWSGRW